MKRDLDLLRTILLAVEKEGDPQEPLLHTLELEGLDQALVNEHVKLLIDDKLLEGECRFSTNNRIMFTAVRGLTPRGYDFLDNVRNDGLWSKLKEHIAASAGTASFDVYEALARQIVTSLVNRPKQA